MRHYCEYILFQLFKWSVLLLPLKSAQRLGAYLGSAAYHLIKSRREVALDNLRYAFPEKSDQERIAIAKGSFKNYGIAFVELLWFPNITKDNILSLMKMKNIERAYHAHDKGKGLILLTGHFGNWELMALATGMYTQWKILIIVQEQSNTFVDTVINRHRCMFGNTVVPMGMSVRDIIRTLDHKGVIGIAGDQSAAKERVRVKFFGRNVATHEGPATFAIRSGAPIVMEFSIRQHDMTYETVFEVIPTDQLPEDKHEAIAELTYRHTAMLERYIRQYPDHWLWMHRRWKHAEEGSDITTVPERTTHA